LTYEKFVRVPVFKAVHEKLSWHWGRRSFVMQSIKRGMREGDIIKITGHSTIEAMKPYFEILQENVNDAMKKAYSD